MAKKFYVTTPIYYINDTPHIGHTFTTLLADVYARYYRALGKEVFFLTGTDENSQKNAEAAQKQEVDFKVYVDKTAQIYRQTWDSLNISYSDFIRTTEPRHQQGVYKFIELVQRNNPDDIYLGNYEGYYCVGCEAFVRERELVDGKCPLHNQEPEWISEENYFFRLTKYRQPLLKHLQKQPEFIEPEVRRQEVITYITKYLEDVSITRPNLKWGIPFPDNPEQTIWVWFDALINYLTGLGFGSNDESLFHKFWPADLHIIGKEISKFHCSIWPGMLLSAGLPLPKQIFVHSFLTVSGQKMSKSLQNVMRPQELVDLFGVDGTRYLLMANAPRDKDSSVSMQHFKSQYNADLANGLGNLVARVAKLCENSHFDFPTGQVDFYREYGDKTWIGKHLSGFNMDRALAYIRENVRRLDKEIDENRLWEKRGQELFSLLTRIIVDIKELASGITPFMPETADKIRKQFQGPKIVFGEPLFPRLD